MMNRRGDKALLAMALFLTASLAQAQPALESPDAPHALHRPAVERALKNHPATHVPAGIVGTPAVFPAAEVAAMPPIGTRGSPLKGWVLLLMGGFLIATISQRRYQALSDL